LCAFLNRIVFSECNFCVLLFFTESIDPRFKLLFNGLAIESTSMTITWQPLALALQGQVVCIEVFWQTISEEEVVYKDCIPAHSHEYTLRSLTPGTMYSIWLGVTLVTEVTVLTQRVHFVTSLHSPGIRS